MATVDRYLRLLRRYVGLLLLLIVSIAAPLGLLELLLRRNVIANEYYARNQVLGGADEDGPLALILGDSFMAPQTGGDIVDYLYDHLAPHGMRVRNTAMAGTGPVQYLASIRRERRLHTPDVLLLSYYVGNDLLDTGCRNGLDERLYEPRSVAAWKQLYTVQFLAERLRAVFPGRVIIETAMWVDRAHQVPVAPLATLTPATMRWHSLFLQAVDYDGMRKAGIAEEHISAAKAGKVNAWIVSLGATKPDYFRDALFVRSSCALRAWENTKRVLDLILDEAVDMNVPVLPVLFPHTFQVSTAHHALYRAWKINVDPEMLETDRPQQLLREFFRARGLEPLDLLAPFRAQQEPLYWEQDEHMNIRGQQLAAKQIADALLARDDASAQGPVTPGATAREGARPRNVAARAAAVPAESVSLPFHVDFADTTSWQTIEGWYPVESAGGKAFAWSQGERSVLRLPLPASQDVRMDLQVMPFVYPGSSPQRVTIVVNGTVVSNVQLRPSRRDYSVILPTRALQRSPQTIELRYEYVRAPRDVVDGSSDVRRLGVAWYSIDFTSTGQSTPP